MERQGIKSKNDKLAAFTAKAYADVITQAAQNESAKVILLSSTTDSIYLSSLVGSFRSWFCIKCCWTL
jgi:electron transfer flavoprotein alpha subunit